MAIVRGRFRRRYIIEDGPAQSHVSWHHLELYDTRLVQSTKTTGVQKKPYTAVTVHVDNLTSEAYEADDVSGIPDLVEVIRIQDTGPTEAARAIRKKL